MNRNLVYLIPLEINNKYTFSPSSRSYISDILKPGIVYNARGSILLKMLMHARIVESDKPKNWTQLCTNSIDISNSFVILHKNSFKDKALLEYLKKRDNFIIFDVVDGKIEDFSSVDAILCCSHGSYSYYLQVQKKAPVLFVEHCIDLRLNPNPLNLGHFSGYYFGALENFLMYNGIFEFIRPCFSTLPHQPVTNWMEYLHLANFHYAVRTKVENNIFKPFTKGAIAALYNSNMIIHKDDGDALYYLGSDYPYLIKENINEKEIIGLLQRAKDDFGGKNWQYGLSIMESIKEQYAHKRVARKFWSELSKL